MLRDGESTMSSSCLSEVGSGAAPANAMPSWQSIDRGLRTIAKRRGALDVEEGALLCLANRTEIWRRFGKPTLLAYMEDVLGYGPKTARDRMRVAIALDEMPVLAEALARGEQSYSALRELTRVVTPNTQREWCDAARGKNLRQIEELVGVHRRGDLPTDPPNPDLSPRVLRFEVTTATYALLRQAQDILADEIGRRLDDNELVATLCTAVIDGAVAGREESATRAKYQVMTTICASCTQGWQQGGGVNVPVSHADVERAECDAQRIGSDRAPTRPTQDVSAAVRRQVHRRDHGACTVPGCRSGRFGEVHHIVPRFEGGGHEAENLTVLCSAHHAALHEGMLSITGRAPNLVFVDRSARAQAVPSHVGRPESDTSILESSASKAGANQPRSESGTSHVGRTGMEMSIREVAAANDAGARSEALASHVGRLNVETSTLKLASDESSTDRPRSEALASHVRRADASHVRPSTVDRASRPAPFAGPSTVSPLDRAARLPTRASHVGRSTYDLVVMKTQAAQALTQAGFKKPDARQMVEAAASQGPPGLTLEQLVRAALGESRKRF